jgi:hypothetical protein
MWGWFKLGVRFLLNLDPWSYMRLPQPKQPRVVTLICDGNCAKQNADALEAMLDQVGEPHTRTRLDLENHSSIRVEFKQ